MAQDTAQPEDRWLISVDDHIIEPPHTWERWLPRKLRDEGPRFVRDELGEAWIYGGRRAPVQQLTAAAGKDRDEFSPFAIDMSEMREGCYDPTARAKDMDRNRVLASVVFPTFAGLCGNTFYEGPDLALGLECIRAYNDFLLQEWCATQPGRFVPIILVPLWDMAAAVREVERCIPLGAKAIGFSENPSRVFRMVGGVEQPLPSIHDAGGYWDPLFAIANEAGLPLCIHIASTTRPLFTSPDAPIHTSGCVSRFVGPQSLTFDWLFSGHFQRFPNLRILMSEGGIGWIPSALDQADYQFRHHNAWLRKIGDFDVSQQGGFSVPTQGVMETKVNRNDLWGDDELPSTVFRRHMFGCFFKDDFGCRHLDEVGFDNAMVEVDYPHSDSTWPNSLPMALEALSGWSREIQDKVLFGNAQRLFNLDLPDPAGLRR